MMIQIFIHRKRLSRVTTPVSLSTFPLPKA